MENNYTIQVSWKFVNYDKDNSSISEPPTIVKYKVKNIFNEQQIDKSKFCI